ncbi:L,D-transpeptidase family protein [Rhizobium sp. ARZ01]|uniref:L,D-transpeptidase family protein n=1 Tax=Rhizobium sp. ARZ01 TaxID=2769313 RepID=UPI001781A1C5|nr:L,D-transpeptidase family protein [Rhizobium sp. ARZ01]MBD9371862.1 L,D-transpeptidase family protein [Rhizobium sp. ARZ01]
MLLRFAAGIGLFALSSVTAVAGTIEGPLQIVVSRDLQTLKVYDGETLVASSNISSGKDGHATPAGIFSILEKKRMHHSNIYDDAPMPYMQRLTWSGIALHASNHVPDYPASHGCVRMPPDFAKSLYSLTQRGGHVLVTGAEAVPRRVEHPALFRPQSDADDGLLLSDAILRPTLPDASDGAVEVAMSEPSAPVTEPVIRKPPGEPVRILITRRTTRQSLKDVQIVLNELGYDVGIADGLAGQKTIAAIRAFQTSEGLTPEGLTSDGNLKPELVEATYRKAGRAVPQNGWLYVRQAFEPLLDGPIEIREPERELGTQFLLAREADPRTGAIDWFAVTMDNELAIPTRKRLGIADPGSIEVTTAVDPITSALDRISIPDELRRKVEALVGDGASITISDTGHELETGKGTDFITLTRPGWRQSSYYAPSTARAKKESSIVVID